MNDIHARIFFFCSPPLYLLGLKGDLGIPKSYLGEAYFKGKQFLPRY